MKQRYAFVFFLLLLLTFGFYIVQQKKQTTLFDKHIIDHIHAQKTNVFFEQADAYKYAQDYARARVAFEQLLPKARNADDSLYTYNQLIYCDLAMNEDSAAGKYIEELERHFPDVEKRGPSVSGDYFYNKGVFCYRVFHPKEAETYLQKALIQYQNVYGEQHLKTAMCMTQLGLFLFEFGRRAEDAFDYLPKAYTIFQSNGLLQQHSAYCELGNAFVSLIKREMIKGTAHCDNAIQLAEKSPFIDTVFIARCLSLKGNFLKKRSQAIKDTAQKQALLNQATQLFETAIGLGVRCGSVRCQQFYRDLIIHLFQKEDFDGYNNKLNELEVILTHQIDRFGQPERLKAYAAYIGKDYQTSRRWYRQFWAHYHKDSLKNTSIFSETQQALALCYDNLGNFDSAKFFIGRDLVRGTPFENQTLSLKQLMSMPHTEYRDFKFIGFGILARIYWHQYEKNKDFDALKTSLSISKFCDEILFQGVTTVDEDAVLHYQRENTDSIYSNAIEAAYLLYQKTKERQYIDLGFRFTERMKSFLMYRNTLDSTVKIDSKLIDSLRLLNAELNQLKWEKDHAHYAPQRIVRVQQKLNDIYLLIEAQYPAYFRSKVVQPIATIAEIQTLLSADRTLVSYNLSGKWAYRFVVSRYYVDFQRIDSTSRINQKVGQLLTYMKDKDTLTAAVYAQLATSVSTQLFGKLPPQYKAPAEWIIIPDRLLNLLPFEALVEPLKDVKPFAKPVADFASLPYLVRRFSFSYTPSWKIYKENCTKTITKNPTIALFTYDTTSFELPAAADEIKVIQAIFSQTTQLFSGVKCSTQLFLTQRTGFDIIHISLHASSDPSEKNNNKIFFSPAYKDALLGFDLLRHYCQTPLIVLSACETGVGTIETGEGVFSLSRSFLQSGSSHVVASLWKINDETSARTLAFFYQNMAKNQPISKALQNAKIQFLNTTKKHKTRPYFWAGLVAMD